MKTFLLLLLIVTIVLAISFVAYGRERTWEALFGSADTGPIDLTKLVRTGKPNDGLICTDGYCPSGLSADAAAPLFEAGPLALIEAIEENMRESGLRYKRVDDRSDANRIRFLTWSNLMRFPDVAEFITIETNDGKTALIGYARAQIGYSDMGANLQRLQMLTRNLN